MGDETEDEEEQPAAATAVRKQMVFDNTAENGLAVMVHGKMGVCRACGRKYRVKRPKQFECSRCWHKNPEQKAWNSYKTLLRRLDDLLGEVERTKGKISTIQMGHPDFKDRIREERAQAIEEADQQRVGAQDMAPEEYGEDPAVPQGPPVTIAIDEALAAIEMTPERAADILLIERCGEREREKKHHRWSDSIVVEWEKREFPQVPPGHCLCCGNALTGKQAKFCSPGCGVEYREGTSGRRSVTWEEFKAAVIQVRRECERCGQAGPMVVNHHTAPPVGPQYDGHNVAIYCEDAEACAQRAANRGD